MDFSDRIKKHSERVKQNSQFLETEEATKTALTMPFLHNVLGYDIFNPNEVIPEFTADIATKKGEKVDYAIMKDGEVQILIECKKWDDTLSKHSDQLYRYFSVTKARLAILTNGQKYQFFTDHDEPNKMDLKPFLIFDMLEPDEHLLPELKKLTKNSFDVDAMVGVAGELKYLSQIKTVLAEQFNTPDEDFVRFFTSKVYDGTQTVKVKAQFLEIVSKALKQFLNDSINDRLKSALSGGENADTAKASSEQGENNQSDEKDADSKIVTTEEELDGFNIVKAILRNEFSVERIIYRDTQSYFGILLDDNNRKPLCRLHFNTKQKYLGIFDQDKKETRHAIDQLDDIFTYADQLIASCQHYKN